MKELYRITVDRKISRTLVGGFESAYDAAKYLEEMLSEGSETFESATIEKYLH